MSATHRRGVLLMLGATLCWGSAGILVRNMTVKDSWEITFWRSLFMLPFLFMYLLRKRLRGKTTRTLHIGRATLLSGALWASMYICFLMALGRTSVANTLVLSSMAPFFAAIAGWIFLRESVPARTWVAILVAMGGIAVMFAGGMGQGAWTGNLIAVLIPIAFAINVIILRGMHADTDPTITLILAGVISALTTLPMALPFDVTARDLVLLAIMGVVQLGLGCLLMITATPYLAAAEVGLLSILETLFGTLSTWLIVGEHPGHATLVGGVIVLGALAVNEVIALRRQAITPVEAQALRSTTGH